MGTFASKPHEEIFGQRDTSRPVSFKGFWTRDASNRLTWSLMDESSAAFVALVDELKRQFEGKEVGGVNDGIGITAYVDLQVSHNGRSGKLTAHFEDLDGVNLFAPKSSEEELLKGIVAVLCPEEGGKEES
uniref:Uncharacterized protein n=1 Tax=Chromera velia CCMP2878 TaxID=1169474 RepID=A0A0G4FS63_9ALVE|eukprot:Cvel_18336.t1-p1 / transcript=Cvel_18336.t1 / gene=Cvel_18336 / organism=Chromera_velia_CCMP2878 / gene_product=hypothetical protein / transcript_product=hypothetical protein / location=Cvel_scaffold1514:10201-10590(+) / protein_length=130 / sequence_SO=supercontig / SO=protein_coding / is_pseudo=false